MALTDRELEALLRDSESDLVERKESLVEKDKVCEAVCAFANDLPNYGRPGVLFIGVTDDGHPSGLAITTELLETLGGIRSNGNVLPLPSLTVRKVLLLGAEMAVVEVQPSLSPPVSYRGRIWIRVGPRRAIASADEVRRLTEKRRSADAPFDVRPVPDASLNDLDLEMFRRDYLPSALPPDVLAENNRESEQQLTAMRFVAPNGPPTVAGVLVLGYEPTAFIPGAYLQFLRLDGTELTDPIKDQKTLSGPLIDMLRQLDELLELNISTSTSVAGPREERTPDYPLVALQQTVRNAIMHRSYENTNAPVRVTWYRDRVEVVNPGGAFGVINQENFGQPGLTDYRNPTIAEAMRALGYVQRFGIGLQLVRSTMQSNRNPPPEFRVEPSHLSVTLRAAP
jgi:ATP-dependent DNA helicase RecG